MVLKKNKFSKKNDFEEKVNFKKQILKKKLNTKNHGLIELRTLRNLCNFKKHDFEEKRISKRHDFE